MNRRGLRMTATRFSPGASIYLLPTELVAFGMSTLAASSNIWLHSG
jgi:hypothetical protein